MLAAGIILFAGIVSSVGLDTIAGKLLELRGNFWVLFAVYPFIFTWNAIGWALAFPRPVPKDAPLSIFVVAR